MSSQQQQQQQRLVEEGLDAYLQRIGKDLPVGSKVRLRLVQGPWPISSIDPVETTPGSSGSSSTIPKQSFPSILKFPPSSTQPPNFQQAPWRTTTTTSNNNNNNSNSNGRLIIENIPKPPDDSDEEDNNNNHSVKTTAVGDMNSDATSASLQPAAAAAAAMSSSSNSNMTNTNKKKRWRYNRTVTPGKQWTLQDQVDFLETMVYRRSVLKYQKQMMQYRKQQQLQQQRGVGQQQPPLPPPAPPEIRSTRYVGIPERMTSHHVLFTLQQENIHSHRNMDDVDNDNRNTTGTIVVQSLPSMEEPIMIPMTQPAVRSHAAFATLSQAAQVMEDQRFAMSTTAASLAFRKVQPPVAQQQPHASQPTTLLRVGGVGKINTTQSRLLQKLRQNDKATAKRNSNRNEEEEDGDDVMADVAYTERKGSSGGARRELLSTFGDGLKVSDDGVVMGGTNDTLFGGRGLKFNRMAVETTSSSDAAGAATNRKTERGADGAAMADDFYTRDVGAEYEEMDYDAAEQFDDDDVDVGETEIQNVGTDGYNEDEYDDDDNDDDSDELDDDDEDDAIGGAEGLASMAGYKALLAKARGEIQGAANSTTTTSDNKTDDNRAASSSPTNVNNNISSGSTTVTATMTTSTSNGDESGTKRSVSPKPDKGKASDDNINKPDHLAKKMAAAEKTAQALKAKKKSNDSNSSPSSSLGNNGVAAAPQVDEQGLRLITLDAVRKEIWLNHGSMPINRLIKIFNANKKHGEGRQNTLKIVIKELCTMTTDPIHGRVLVLKQHYSHMT